MAPELDLRQKNQHFLLGRAADRVRPECAPGQLLAPHEIPRRPGPRSELSGSAQTTRLGDGVLLTALTNFRPPPKYTMLRRQISSESLFLPLAKRLAFRMTGRQQRPAMKPESPVKTASPNSVRYSHKKITIIGSKTKTSNLSVGCHSQVEPVYQPKIGIFGHFGLGLAGSLHWVPCWWVGWWLWRAGCISQDTYLHYKLINGPSFSTASNSNQTQLSQCMANWKFFQSSILAAACLSQ